MPRVSFDQLPLNSRLWIFPVSRPLTSAEREDLLSRVDSFLEEWNAHGTPLTGGRDWREDRFLLIGVDDSAAPPSGCSIDRMAGTLKELGREWGMSFLDHSPVWFRGKEGVKSVSRSEFKEMVRGGKVNLDTSVFDNAVVRVSDLEGKGWEKPAGASWHRRAFFTEEGV